MDHDPDLRDPSDGGRGGVGGASAAPWHQTQPGPLDPMMSSCCPWVLCPVPPPPPWEGPALSLPALRDPVAPVVLVPALVERVKAGLRVSGCTCVPVMKVLLLKLGCVLQGWPRWRRSWRRAVRRGQRAVGSARSPREDRLQVSPPRKIRLQPALVSTEISFFWC